MGIVKIEREARPFELISDKIMKSGVGGKIFFYGIPCIVLSVKILIPNKRWEITMVCDAGYDSYILMRSKYLPAEG